MTLTITITLTLNLTIKNNTIKFTSSPNFIIWYNHTRKVHCIAHLSPKIDKLGNIKSSQNRYDQTFDRHQPLLVAYDKH